jgi:hypothetical protein
MSDEVSLVEKVAAVIGEAERLSCGGYRYEGTDPKLNPWLTDKHRMFAQAAIAATPLVKMREALEAIAAHPDRDGSEAHSYYTLKNIAQEALSSNLEGG